MACGARGLRQGRWFLSVDCAGIEQGGKILGAISSTLVNCSCASGVVAGTIQGNGQIVARAGNGGEGFHCFFQNGDGLSEVAHGQQNQPVLD